ncbi:hypothetical protein MKW92_040393, partial [Papaver armeniacum]
TQNGKELKEGIELKINFPEGTSLVITSLLGKEEEDEKPVVSVGPDVNEDDMNITGIIFDLDLDFDDLNLYRTESRDEEWSS